MGEFRLRWDQVEDLVQDVFRMILDRWEGYRSMGGDRLLALSRKMMRDKAVDEIRRRHRRRDVPLDASPSEPLARGSSESSGGAEAKERKDWLEARVGELRRYHKQYHDLVCAHYLRGLTWQELADTARCSVHAIKCRMTRALRVLRRLAAEHPP